MESTESMDRLSELPISLTHSILSFLPMTDVVRTTILSKHWHNLWTTLHSLHFHFAESKDTLSSIPNFVDGALRLWKGSKILKFKLVLTFFDGYEYSDDLDSWLTVPIENQVEELYVALIDINRRSWDPFMSDSFFAPRSLSSSSSITGLTLICCNLRFNGGIQWPHLKSLSLQCVCLNADMISQILRGSPLLQVLILVSSDCYEDWNIESTSLKALKIECLSFCLEDHDHVEKLRIWAPNLESLEISGCYFHGKCLLIDLSSLKSVTFLIPPPMFNPPIPNSISRLVEEILVDVLQRINHVENITLSDWCTKVLGEMKKSGMVASVPTVKSLTLYANNVVDVISLVEVFPNLSSLVVECKNSIKNSYMFSCISLVDVVCGEPFLPVFAADNNSETNLLHLKTVDITWVLHDNDIFRFIQTLLKNARNLEKMVFRVRGYISRADRKDLPVVENMLHNLPRSSPSVVLEFDFLDEGFHPCLHSYD